MACLLAQVFRFALAGRGIRTWAADALRAKGKHLETAPDHSGLGAAVERPPLPFGTWVWPMFVRNA
jgi:hypothetical protein